VSEVRTGKRFEVHLPIKISSPESPDSHVGETDNLSAAGVYLSLDSSLEVGSPVEFDITMPASVIGSEKDVRIHCTGRVVRTEAPKEGTRNSGVACVIDGYEFIR
jgi:hypothetical protein